MNSHKFRFRKTAARNGWTKIFGGIGRRRSIKDFFSTKAPVKKRFNMQMVRRSHQGHRNKVFGSLNALKIRLQFGRMPTISDFRR